MYVLKRKTDGTVLVDLDGNPTSFDTLSEAEDAVEDFTDYEPEYVWSM